MTDADKMLYTIPEVAEILQTNQGYIHRLRKCGLLPVLKLGRYKVRRQALEKFLAEYEGKDVDSILTNLESTRDPKTPYSYY